MDSHCRTASSVNKFMDLFLTSGQLFFDSYLKKMVRFACFAIRVRITKWYHSRQTAEKHLQILEQRFRAKCYPIICGCGIWVDTLPLCDIDVGTISESFCIAEPWEKSYCFSQ